jgi:hypothetical protein
MVELKTATYPYRRPAKTQDFSWNGVFLYTFFPATAHVHAFCYEDKNEHYQRAVGQFL